MLESLRAAGTMTRHVFISATVYDYQKNWCQPITKPTVQTYPEKE